MSCTTNLALAAMAYKEGNKEECLDYIAKACEFGDDLTQFVSEVIRKPSSPRNFSNNNPSDNTLSPSLASSNMEVTAGCVTLKRIQD